MAGNLSGRVALVIQYDGSKYAGWQYQANAVTVQEKVEQALADLFQQPLPVRAASRTDAGVHARGQVAAVDLPRPFPRERLAAALNWHLPADIKVARGYPVPKDFDSRIWAQGKIYRYYICNRPQPPALGYSYCCHVGRLLDIPAMNRAAQHCLGTHDFASFQSAGSEVENTVRTIRHLFCFRRGESVVITCVGDGFLYKMVRTIVGTLINTGLGKQHPRQMKAIIDAASRSAAGPTATAKGLFLERVLYRPSLDSYGRL